MKGLIDLNEMFVELKKKNKQYLAEGCIHLNEMFVERKQTKRFSGVQSQSGLWELHGVRGWLP